MDHNELRGWREGHDLTQAQLALILGTTAKTICVWESPDGRVPAWVPLALKGFKFSHGELAHGLCCCTQCFKRRRAATARATEVAAALCG